MAQPPPAPPPPPQPPGTGPYPPAAHPRRPSGITAAAALLLAAGGAGSLYSFLFLILTAANLEEIRGLFERAVGSEAGGAIGVFVAILAMLLVIHVFQIVAGIRVLRGRGGTLGITFAILGLLMWLLILALGFAQGSVDPLGLLVGVISIGGGIATTILLAQNRSFFSAREGIT